MTDKKRRAYRLLLALLLLWGAHQLFTLYQIHFPNRSHPMTPPAARHANLLRR
jgi:hypothetical protein